MRTSTLRRTVPLAVVAVMFGLAACDPTPPPAVTSTPLGYIPKCPTHPFALEVAEQDTGHVWVKRVVTTIDLAGPLTPVVEVHDCQRLILHDAAKSPSLSYGPLALIFAGDSVKSLFAGSDSARGAAARPQRAAAVIYSWWKDDPRTGDYEALGIEGGWNCLYLSQSGGGVEARMVPAEKQSDCLKPPAAEGTLLEVHAEAPPNGMTEDDIPPVARWGWAKAGTGPTNDIWIRCGRLACEVGPKNFKSEPKLPGDTRLEVLGLDGFGTSVEAHRVVEVPGWYDQQLLAVEEGGELQVGGVLATLIPFPKLGAQNNESVFDGGWQPVAVAYLPAASAPYSAKLNLEQGANVISMRHGARDAVFPAGTTAPPCKKDNGPDPWWARVVSKSGVTRYYCMNRYKHSLPPSMMPGTTRWQWLDDDEKTWIRCPQGCCPIT